MIKVSIAKLGNPIQEVEVSDVATVMEALKAASYNLDSVLSVKRNGTSVSMDTSLSDGDVLLVSQDKIKGGVEDEVAPEATWTAIKVSFDVIVEGETSSNQLLFMDNQSAFEVIKTVLHGKGISMNHFKELRTVEGVKLGLDTKLVDGTKYVIVLEKPNHRDEEDEGDDD